MYYSVVFRREIGKKFVVYLIKLIVNKFLKNIFMEWDEIIKDVDGGDCRGCCFREGK